MSELTCSIILMNNNFLVVYIYRLSCISLTMELLSWNNSNKTWAERQEVSGGHLLSPPPHQPLSAS